MLQGVIIFFLLGICLLAYMVKSAFGNQVKEQEIASKDFPASIDKLALFFISDIHRRVVSSQIIEKIEGKVDFVIIGGDLGEKGTSYQDIDTNLAALANVAPLIFVWGNNDYELNEKRLEYLFAKYHVEVLKNEVMHICDDKIAIIGTDDLSTHRLPPLSGMLEQVREGAFQILVSHNPGIIRLLPENHAVSLTLSGHTHGGQIRLFGMGRYERGSLKATKGTILLVSNGYGTSLLPLRLGAPAETHLLVLKRADSSPFHLS